MSGVNLRTEPLVPHVEPLMPPVEPPVSPIDVETLVPTPAQSPEHTIPSPKHNSDLEEIPQRPVSPINIDSDIDSSKKNSVWV